MTFKEKINEVIRELEDYPVEEYELKEEFHKSGYVFGFNEEDLADRIQDGRNRDDLYAKLILFGMEKGLEMAKDIKASIDDENADYQGFVEHVKIWEEKRIPVSIKDLINLSKKYNTPIPESLKK